MELQRFAFSTHAYSRHSLQHALNRIADAGFKGVEILADKPHAWMDTFTAADQLRLIKQIVKHDFFVSNVDANTTVGFWSDAPPEPIFEPSLVSRSRQYREWRIAYSKKALRLGKALHAKNVSLTSGRALHGVPPEKAYEYLNEGLERLTNYAEKIGQRFSLHCEPTLLIERTNELAALFQKIKSPFLGVNFDIVNVETAGDDVSKALEKLKGRIFNVQLADVLGHKNFRRVPGDGDIDFARIFKTLKTIGYDGPLTWDLQSLDDDPDAACAKTFKYMKTLTKK